MVSVHIISIGNELLSGVTNTNASWLASQLFANSIPVSKVHTIADEPKTLKKCLDEALAEADIVITTGGLGPTVDDITKKVLCKYFNCGLKFSHSTYDNIEKLFNSRGLSVTQTNKKQAEIPEIAKPIPNITGTAPGLWFNVNDKTLIALPGVPFEMHIMFSNFIVPELKNKYKLPKILSRTVLTHGLGESFLSDTIHKWEKQVPSFVKLAYLPSPGLVKIQLTGVDDANGMVKNTIDKLVTELQDIIPDYIFGYDHQTLQELTGSLLLAKKAKLSIAESCTGGFISHLMTSCPGSSEYYTGGVVAYDNDLKIRLLNIEKTLIEQFGAVSQQVVEAMALNVRKLLKTDYSIATTGIAGPGVGSKEKPVGTVWIAVATPHKLKSQKFRLGQNRQTNIVVAAHTALNMLRKILAADVQEET